MELEDTKDDIFKEHLDLNNLMNGIKKGEIMKGKLKIETQILNIVTHIQCKLRI